MSLGGVLAFCYSNKDQFAGITVVVHEKREREEEEEREQSRRVRGVLEEISEWRRGHCGDYFRRDTLLDVQD